MKRALFLAFTLALLMVFGMASDAQAVDPDIYLTPSASESLGPTQELGTAEDFAGTNSAGGAFGEGTQDYWIAATEFTPIDNGCSMDYAGLYGFSMAGTCSNDWAFAQLNLPAGARTTTVMCYAYDVDGSVDVQWNFDRVEYDYSTGPITITTLATQTKAWSSGWTEIWTSANHTILYRDGDFRQMYFVNVRLNAGNANLRLYGCRVWWHRQISPAPAVQTFPDVAPGFWAFQDIEALAASGITTGFPDGTFRPTANVTRAQMAAFLARALGLHWPF